ncbi:hypothetical protein NQ317_008264 [Molorchus minor]|uniref:Uncharacterized protein n=1 Tax=Molorchus minor TaxID=1323400 RepID=A0ABQ9J9Y1_9CUCU|nr:hypothetical protein NQ317_008264 [Molorchus minor]
MAAMHMVASGEPQPIPIESAVPLSQNTPPAASNEGDRVILNTTRRSTITRVQQVFKQLLLSLGTEHCLQVLLFILTRTENFDTLVEAGYVDFVR